MASREPPRQPPRSSAGAVGRHGRKSGPDDAVSVAVAARSVPSLRQVGVKDQATMLHLLTKRRQDLVAARPDHQPAPPAADGPGPRRRQAQPHRQPRRRAARPGHCHRRTGGHPLAVGHRACGRRASAGAADCRGGGAHQDRVAQANTSLLELFGVGPVLAARFLGEVGDIRRFPSKHHFPALGSASQGRCEAGRCCTRSASPPPVPGLPAGW
jgi:transposase